MENIQNFMLNHILYYHFPKKKLAEKSYSTFNLRLSMVWAAAVPIKTNYSRVSCVATIHWQEAELATCLKFKSFDNFFQQVLSEKW